ncbi:hypothetical protein [Aromatoleum sp.]|uniref:hypothetical protein n=1 Tax=Aromatoleum sp. TaxID=2307007 RepID=UPI002FC7A3CC
MTTIMDMNSGKELVEPEEYDDEVLNASWLPPQPEPALRAAEIDHGRQEKPLPPLDAESFLKAVYRYQE